MAANRIRIALQSERNKPWRSLHPAVFARHSAWAADVMRRFQPRSAPLHRNFAEFVFAGTQKWHLFTQVVQVTRPLHQHVDFSLRVAPTLRQEVYLSGQAVTPTLQTAEPPLPSGRNGTIFASRVHPVRPARNHSPARLHLCTLPARMLSLPAESGPVRATMFSFLRLPRMESDERQEMTIETAGGQAGGRIVCRLQRVEELPVYPPIEMNSGVTNRKSHPDLVFQSTTLPEPTPVRRGTGSSVVPPPTSAPAFNFGAITDEVMRQIDRRLVATRERMGKV